MMMKIVSHLRLGGWLRSAPLRGDALGVFR